MRRALLVQALGFNISSRLMQPTKIYCIKLYLYAGTCNFGTRLVVSSSASFSTPSECENYSFSKFFRLHIIYSMNLHNSQKYVANLNAAMRQKGCVKRFEKCSAEKISLFSPTAILQLCKQFANLTRLTTDLMTSSSKIASNI